MYKMGSCNRSKIQDEDNSLKLFVINLKKNKMNLYLNYH
jgi:hypothetical protein